MKSFSSTQTKLELGSYEGENSCLPISDMFFLKNFPSPYKNYLLVYVHLILCPPCRYAPISVTKFIYHILYACSNSDMNFWTGHWYFHQMLIPTLAQVTMANELCVQVAYINLSPLPLKLSLTSTSLNTPIVYYATFPTAMLWYSHKDYYSLENFPLVIIWVDNQINKNSSPVVLDEMPVILRKAGSPWVPHIPTKSVGIPIIYKLRAPRVLCWLGEN